MPTNPNAKRVLSHAETSEEAICALNAEVDKAFDEGLAVYQTSQENTLRQIDELIARSQERIRVAAEGAIKAADRKACDDIIAAYRESGLKGDDNAE